MAASKKQSDEPRVDQSAEDEPTAEETALFDRRDQVAAMWIRGYSQREIGERLGGLSQQTVSRDLAWVREQWAKRGNSKTLELRGEQLAKLDALEREYWLAWYRSQTDAEKSVESTHPTNGDTLTLTTEKQIGDVRYLQGVGRCIEQRCDILGLKAPQRTEIAQRTVVYVDKELADGV